MDYSRDKNWISMDTVHPPVSSNVASWEILELNGGFIYII